MNKKTIFVSVLFFVVLFFTHHDSVFATKYELIAPTGTLTRGQDVTFQLNVDTEGQSMSTANVGLTYKTEFLQYKSITPEDTFSTVTATADGNGNLSISASQSSGYSGSGTLASITFSLVAQSAGSTELCTLTTPTTPPQATNTPSATSSAQPTRLPTTGGYGGTIYSVLFGTLFIGLAGTLIWMNSRDQNKLH